MQNVRHERPEAVYFLKNETLNLTVSGESVLLVLRMISSSRWKRKQHSLKYFHSENTFTVFHKTDFSAHPVSIINLKMLTS